MGGAASLGGRASPPAISLGAPSAAGLGPLHGLPVADIDRADIANWLGILATENGPMAAHRARFCPPSSPGRCARDWSRPTRLSAPTIRPNLSHKERTCLPMASWLRFGELVATRLWPDHSAPRPHWPTPRGNRCPGLAGDLERRTISLPRDRTKNHRPHEVPLSDRALRHERTFRKPLNPMGR